MKKIIIVIILLSVACKIATEKKQRVKIEEQKVITTDDYELHLAKHQKALLILFPGGGGSPKNIKKEFNIFQKAKKEGISLLLMRFTNKLWIEKDDCRKITTQIEKAIKDNHLKTNNMYIGGISLGGNITLTLTQHLLKYSSLQPKGAFIVDSPIDLYGLYESSVKDTKRKDFSEERLAEPKWIINYFEEKFSKDSLLTNIQKVSPFTFKTANISNIDGLKNIKLNLYIEPDKKWYKEVRQTDFESTNAYSIQKMYIVLKEKGWEKVQLIETNNKGHRADGERNPHSWSIVNVDELIKWMLQ